MFTEVNRSFSLWNLTLYVAVFYVGKKGNSFLFWLLSLGNCLASQVMHFDSVLDTMIIKLWNCLECAELKSADLSFCGFMLISGAMALLHPWWCFAQSFSIHGIKIRHRNLKGLLKAGYLASVKAKDRPSEVRLKNSECLTCFSFFLSRIFIAFKSMSQSGLRILNKIKSNH